jgi:hypothetical protein
MYRHIVLMQWKEDATPEAIQKCIDGLRSLRDIPFVHSVIVEENVQTFDTTYSHGLIVDCVDRESFKNYNAHEIHKRVIAEDYRPVVGNRAIFDLEF